MLSKEAYHSVKGGLYWSQKQPLLESIESLDRDRARKSYCLKMTASSSVTAHHFTTRCVKKDKLLMPKDIDY